MDNNPFLSSPSLKPLALALGTFVFYKLVILIWREWIINPQNDLPGPKAPSWLYGHMGQIFGADHVDTHGEWVKTYGTTIRYKTFFGMSRLLTMDMKALNHVLMNNQIYYKPEEPKRFIGMLVGNGVLLVEGAKHKEQRKVMNPAFGVSQIRELTEIFVEKALELRDVWAGGIKKKATQDMGEIEHQSRVNVLNGLSKMTLDVIGLAGFNYKFNSLQGERNELNEAFNTMFSVRRVLSGMLFLRTLLGSLGSLVPLRGDNARRQARATMDEIGRQLLKDSKSALEKALMDGSGEMDERYRRRDLLSLLIKANTSTEVPEGQRMSDEDVLAQVPTFLVAGHETTSNATAWGLYALSLNPTIQTKLREELYTIQTDNPSMDELNSLPYLDAVVRETLRVHAPVPSTMRVAVKDDVVPLGTPFVDRKGRIQDSIKVRKGQTVYIPILAINRLEELWGPDSSEFKPERWESVQEAANAIPGVWGNMLTFLGGPRACIGYRFSLVEMKALLFTLVRAFEFKLAVPPNEIGRRGAVVQRPFLVNEPSAGNQMPMFLSPYIRVD